MILEDLVRKPVAFDWDLGNISKNWKKHRVSVAECEDVFFNDPLIYVDQVHSQKESRYFAFGTTDQTRLLFIVFTIRKNKIRIISARDMHKKERKYYYEEIKKNPTIQD